MRSVSHLVPVQQQSAIEYAKGLLARCESGEVISVTAIEQTPRNTYAILGSATTNRFEAAGMLLNAAMRRLEDED